MASGLSIVLVLCLFSCCHAIIFGCREHANCIRQCGGTKQCCKSCRAIRQESKSPTKRKFMIGVPWYTLENRAQHKGGNRDEIGTSRFLKISSPGNMSPVSQYEDTFKVASYYNPSKFNYYEYYRK